VGVSFGLTESYCSYCHNKKTSSSGGQAEEGGVYTFYDKGAGQGNSFEEFSCL
jgi:hypothetical protein